MLDRATKTIIKGLKEAVCKMPEGFHDSFDFTRTGYNLCHPVTLGALAIIVSNMKDVAYVGIDVRLNRKGVKFQPDVVGFREDRSPVVYVDFESPNSSDARVPYKDVKSYLEWSEPEPKKTPYIVVTSLPNRAAPNWQIRWTAHGQYNERHKGSLTTEIKKNPLSYWSKEWREEMTKFDTSSVAIINIDGKNVERVSL